VPEHTPPRSQHPPATRPRRPRRSPAIRTLPDRALSAPATASLGEALARVAGRIDLGILLLDIHGAIRWANTHARALLGDGQPLAGALLSDALDRLALPRHSLDAARQGLEVLVTDALVPEYAVDLSGAALSNGAALRLRAFALDPPDRDAGYAVLLESAASDHASPVVRPEGVTVRDHAPLIGLLAAVNSEVAQLSGGHGPHDGDEATPPAQRIAAGITRALDALKALDELHDLRQAQRPEHLTPVDPADLLMGIMPRWKPRAPLHSFELALPGELPAVTADARLVERALDLTLAAAVAVAPLGGTVRVDVRPFAEEIVVAVHSRGPSLSDDELADLCEPFAALPRIGVHLPEGGMGLCLARAIVALHGGRLRIERLSDGPGTLFMSIWPLVPPPVTGAASLSPATSAGEPDSASSIPGIGITRPQPVVLLLDRDPRMARYLRANLEARQFRPALATSVDELYRLAELEEPDLTLVDVSVAEVDACTLVRHLHDTCGAPVIALSRRYDAEECVRLLEAGARDYIAKPLSIEELLARVRVALRERDARTRTEPREPIFRSGDLAIDFAQRTVTVAGRPIALSRTEYKLLRALAQHAGMVLSHETLLERVWGAGYSHEIAFIWVYIRRLRTKIEPDPGSPRYIQTVSGVGYRLARL
jgi:DNA-binding response OmpR family regulator/signal transduction histidine kinase